MNLFCGIVVLLFIFIQFYTPTNSGSRVILSYLVASYSKDDTLYPRDIRMRALVDHRLQFDLGTLAARSGDYFVSGYIFFPRNAVYFIHFIHFEFCLLIFPFFPLRT